MASLPGVGLARGTGAGTVLAAGPSAVTALVDAEVTEGVGSGVVSSGGGVGLLAVSAAGRAVDGWVVGPPVDVSGACVELVGSAGLAVEGRGVCSAGPCEPGAPPAFSVTATAVCVLVASVVQGAAVGNVPSLGAWAWGVPGAAVDAGAGCVDHVGVGAREAVRLAGPTAVLGVVPAVTAGELWLAPQVSLASVTGEGVARPSEVL